MSSAEALAEAVRRGERRAVAKAITLVESTRRDDADAAERLLSALFPFTGRALRLGVSGVPGAGKSTLIDAVGLCAVSSGQRVGVLTVDPSSRVSGGSILGDRTRMGRLGQSEYAFVRPSPSAGASGGLSLRTREAALVLDAAGYDLLIIETVGVGQAEVQITELADLVLLVLLAGAGDEVQAMKRGILEHADIIAFNKADGENAPLAQAARDEMSAALGWLRKQAPPVFAVSARDGEGTQPLYEATRALFARGQSDGSFERRRREQRLRWLDEVIERELYARFESRANALKKRELTDAVARGELLPLRAAHELLGTLEGAAEL